MERSQRLIYIIGIGAMIIGIGVLVLVYLTYVEQTNRQQEAPLYSGQTATEESDRFSEAPDEWQVYTAPLQTQLLAITPLSSDVLLAVGTEGLMLTSTDAGGSWRSLSTTTTTPLYDVDFFEDTRGIAGGELPPAQVRATQTARTATGEVATTELPARGTLLFSVNRGDSWQAADIPRNSGVIYGVAYHSDAWLTAVGDNGTVLRSTDRGETWTQQLLTEVATSEATAETSTAEELPATSATQEQQQPVFSARLYDVSVGPVSVGLIVGEAGTILRTTDAGVSWTATASSEEVHAYTWYGSHVANRRTLFAVGERGKVLRSADRGETWKVIDTPTDKNLYAIAFAGPDLGYAVGSDGVILRTHDRGLTWTLEDPVTEYALTDIAVTDNVIVFVGREGTIVTKRR